METIETNPLPGCTVRTVRDGERFVEAVVWEHGIRKGRTYTTHRGLTRALTALLAKIAAAEGQAGYMTWVGAPMQLAEHPATAGTVWASWTPSDGIQWDHRPESASRSDIEAKMPDPLTLGSLRQLLSELARTHGPGTPIVLQRDPEGNGFAYAYQYHLGPFRHDGWGQGEMLPTPEELANDPELRRLFGSVPTDAATAICLVPMA